MVRVENLVVDSSGFIKCLNIQDIGENIYTIDEVVAEIRDKTTRQRLSLTPYTLHFKHPAQQAVHAVSEFSKLSGEYSSLSPVDIQLLALCYHLERESVGGTDHLRHKPQASKQDVQPASGAGGCVLTGFYNPPANAEGSGDAGDSDGEGPSDGDDDEDDGGGWITADMLHQQKQQQAGASPGNSDTVKVACLTTDYAMQNVLLQMGLCVVSPSGAVITETRSYIKRCYGCFRLCYDTSAIFCPGCGNRTMRKVGVTVSDGGEVTIDVSGRVRVNTRGMNAPLRRPHGGKHQHNAVVRPDQPLPQQRASSRRVGGGGRSATDPLDPDYAGGSPFTMRDVTSRAFITGHQHQQGAAAAGRRRRRR